MDSTTLCWTCVHIMGLNGIPFHVPVALHLSVTALTCPIITNSNNCYCDMTSNVESEVKPRKPIIAGFPRVPRYPGTRPLRQSGQ